MYRVKLYCVNIVDIIVNITYIYISKYIYCVGIPMIPTPLTERVGK